MHIDADQTSRLYLSIPLMHAKPIFTHGVMPPGKQKQAGEIRATPVEFNNLDRVAEVMI